MINQIWGQFKLGKRGEIFDFAKIKAGVVENEKNKLIFEKFDKNNNGVLEKEEVKELQGKILPFSKDGVVSKREANKILKDIGLSEAKSEVFFEFLQSIGTSSEEVEDCFYSLFENGKESVNIKYKKDEEGYVRTSSRDAKTGALIQDSYDNGVLSKTVYYSEDGSISGEEIKQGAKTTFKDSLGRVVKEVINKGSGISEVTEYEYEGTSAEAKNITNKKFVDGVEIKEPETPVQDKNKKVFANGRIMVKTENGTTLQDPNGEPVEIKYDKDGNILSNAKSGETFDQTAERLGIKKGTQEFEKFKELNAKAAKNGWFNVGAEVKIPAGLEDKINLEGLNVDSSAEVSKFEKNAIKDADVSKYTEENTEKKVLDKNTTWWQLAKDTLKSEGKENPTNAEISERTKELQKLNNGKEPVKGSEVILPKIQQVVAESEVLLEVEEVEPIPETEEPAEVPESTEPTTTPTEPTPEETPVVISDFLDKIEDIKIDDLDFITRAGAEVAEDLYEDIHQWGTGEKFEKHIKQIKTDNVIDVLKTYAEKSPDESLIEAIFDEVGLDLEKEQIPAVNHIKDKLIERSNNLGVEVSVLNQEFEKAFDEATTGMLAKVGYIDTEKLDNLVNEYMNRIDTMEKMDVAARERWLKEQGFSYVHKTEELEKIVEESGHNLDNSLGDGKINNPSVQITGNCWAHAGLSAFTATSKGQELINNLVTKRNGVVSVYLPEAAQKGLPKPNGDGIYTITENEILTGMIEQSVGDGDVTAVMLAIEKYFTESGENEGSEFRTNGNKPYRMFEILTGKKNEVYAIAGSYIHGEENGLSSIKVLDGVSTTLYNGQTNDNMEDAHYQLLQKLLAQGEGAVYITFSDGTNPENETSAESLDLNYAKSDNKKPFISDNHGYAVMKMDDEFVYLKESNNPKVIIKMPKEEFVKKVNSVVTCKF